MKILKITQRWLNDTLLAFRIHIKALTIANFALAEKFSYLTSFWETSH